MTTASWPLIATGLSWVPHIINKLLIKNKIQVEGIVQWLIVLLQRTTGVQLLTHPVARN